MLEEFPCSIEEIRKLPCVILSQGYFMVAGGPAGAAKLAEQKSRIRAAWDYKTGQETYMLTAKKALSAQDGTEEAEEDGIGASQLREHDRTSRFEHEWEVRSQESFAALWQHTVGTRGDQPHEFRITKARFFLERDGHTTEIDVFLEPEGLHGFVLAEIEFESEEVAEAFKQQEQNPFPFLGENITNKSSLGNSSLAKRHKPPEKYKAKGFTGNEALVAVAKERLEQRNASGSSYFSLAST
jgi:CYTH domain-containing protein